MRGTRRALVVLMAAAVVGGCGGEKGKGSTGQQQHGNADAALVQAMSDSAQWPAYGRDQTNERYSPLGQVNATNVSNLQLAWKYHTGISQAFENSPVIVGPTMYVSTALNHLVALDAATGQKKWEYVHEFNGPTVHCCGPVSRGVAYYDGKIYMGTLDARLVALDAADGHKVWDTRVDDNKRGYAITMPAVAAAGKVLVGVSGGEYGIRGHVDAYDAATGKLVWRFYTIPAPDEPPGGWFGKWGNTDAFGTVVHKDRTKERADSARYADAWKVGGGGVWQAPAIDRQLGMVYFSVGNPSPDLDGSVRPGDNLFTDCIVAIDLNTGKYKWHLQEVPHDVWDVDAISPVVLFDTKDASGQTVPALGQAGKTGWVYILDRRSGQPIRRSDPFVPQKNMFAEPTPQGTFMIPGANGGSEWSAPAYSPQTGALYVLGLHQPMLYKSGHAPLAAPAMWLSGAFIGVTPQAGIFSAVAVNTGKVLWQQIFPDPMIGGALATAGGVVFTGLKDQRFLAMDAKSGKILWTYQADAGVNAPPVSFMEGGKQYVAVAAGGNYQIDAPRGDEVLVFSLGQPRSAQNNNGAPAAKLTHDNQQATRAAATIMASGNQTRRP